MNNVELCSTFFSVGSDYRQRYTWLAFMRASWQTGLLVTPNNVSALAKTLECIAANRARLREYGLRALSDARSTTHQEMHRQRAVLLTTMMVGKEATGM